MLQRSVLVLATTLLATPAVAQDATDSWSDVKYPTCCPRPLFSTSLERCGQARWLD